MVGTEEGLVLPAPRQGLRRAPAPATTAATWAAGWSVAKKAWCCQHQGKGCPPKASGCGSSQPYDCAAGFANWQAGWSAPKKAWCCQHEGKGCAATPCPTSRWDFRRGARGVA